MRSHFYLEVTLRSRNRMFTHVKWTLPSTLLAKCRLVGDLDKEKDEIDKPTLSSYDPNSLPVAEIGDSRPHMSKLKTIHGYQFRAKLFRNRTK